MVWLSFQHQSARQIHLFVLRVLEDVRFPVRLVAVAPQRRLLLVHGAGQRLQVGEVVAVGQVVDVHEHGLGARVVERDVGFGDGALRAHAQNLAQNDV